VTERSGSFHLAIENELEAVGKAQQELEEFLLGRAVDPGAVFPVVLALEEVVTNVIKYSYDDAGAHRILIDARVGAEEIVLRVVDDGREFDPLSAPPPDFTKPVEERPIGGLGVHLLRAYTRRIDYGRLGGKNELTLFFPVHAEP
jgi:anti-sigma regulatory factor (Ser/Thr protein kinase)